MNRKIINKLAKYWALTAQHDYDTMIGLFEIKRFSDALFYGHITIEKVLKATIIVNKREYAPPIHDLLELSRLSGLELPLEEQDLLKTINTFNIRARYPDYKFNFYRKCDCDFTGFYLIKIKELYKKICLDPKLKKLL